jgi:hypothetical protein
VNARGLLSVLFHAEKALDLVQTAREIGLLEQLDAGPVALRDLVETTGAQPLRLYKFLDGLESLGLVAREQPSDELLSARFVSREPLAAAVEAVLGEHSIERDQDTYPWREIHGRLGDVLRGNLDGRFDWPPRNDDDVRAFEASMAAGCAPMVEALRGAPEALFGPLCGPSRESCTRCATAWRSGARSAPKENWQPAKGIRSPARRTNHRVRGVSYAGPSYPSTVLDLLPHRRRWVLEPVT